MKIVLTGGGTAGHVTPHLALLKDFKKTFQDVIYIGSKEGIEKDIISKQNIKYYSITTTKLVRKKVFKNLTIPFKLLKGIKEAKEILKREKPDVLFSKGGFVSLPVVLASHQLKIPVVIHESDLSIGLANKIASKYAKTVCTTFEKTAEKYGKKGLFTGSPIRQCSKKFTSPFDNNNPIITITGGSLGAEPINKTIFQALPNLLKKYNIIHIVGKGNLTDYSHKNYKQIEFTENILSILENSHIVISRSGSNTIFELLHLCVPMILIPLPKGNSRGDQIENAKYFKDKKYAFVLPQSELDANSLMDAIFYVEENIKDYIYNMKSAYIPNSNALIIDAVACAMK